MTALDTGHDPDQTDLAAPADPTGRDAGSATPRGPVRPDLGSVDAATRAFQRRMRREQRMTGQRLTGSGRPVRAALARLPFVLVNIGLLAAAIVGVLWLTTMKDEAGLRATASQAAQSSLQIQIESGNRDIQSLAALPRIDAAARSLGMVPAGDAPILQVSGTATTVIGTPAPASGAAPAQAPTAQAPTTPAATMPAATTPAATHPAPTTPAATAPVTSAPPVTKAPATKTPPTKTPDAAAATKASGAVAPSSPAGPPSGAKTTGAAVAKTSPAPTAGTVARGSTGAGSSASTAPTAAASAGTTPTSKKAGR